MKGTYIFVGYNVTNDTGSALDHFPRMFVHVCCKLLYAQNPLSHTMQLHGFSPLCDYRTYSKHSLIISMLSHCFTQTYYHVTISFLIIDTK